MGRTHSHCRRCGFGVPEDSPLCPGCRRPAVDDWRARARRIEVLERKARREAPPLHDHGYRSLLRTASLARSMLWLTATAAVATMSIYVLWIARAGEPSLTVESTTFEIEPISRLATLSLLALGAVTGAFFVAWALRAYRNLPALGIQDRRYWTIWLVLGWVIPGANLFVPKLLVDDIWRASSPRVPIDGGPAWQRRPVASIVNRWWWSFLVTPAIIVLAVVTARAGVGEASQQAAVGALSIVATGALVVASVAARRLIAVVTVAQARRADLIVDLRGDEQAAVEHRLAVQRATERPTFVADERRGA